MNLRANPFTKLLWMSQAFSPIQSHCLADKPRPERIGLAFSMMLEKAARTSQITKPAIRELANMKQMTERRQEDRRAFSVAVIYLQIVREDHLTMKVQVASALDLGQMHQWHR